MAHAGVAVALNAPRWSLDDGEGEKLALAIQKVARHYNIPDVASETKDWIGLIITVGAIYGTRFASMWAEKNTPPPPPPKQEQDDKIVSLVGSMNHPGPGL